MADLHPATKIVAFPSVHIPNPLRWLGSEASKVAADAWKAAMTGLWSAALWLLQLAFKIIDAFTEPDLSAHGPMGAILPTTMWLGGAVVGVMFFVQLALALVRRDGKSLGQVLTGTVQFGAVWVGYLGVAGGLVLAASGLEKGILQSMLHVDAFSAVDLSHSWPRSIDDATIATVLGVSGLLLVIPAAFLYLIIMFVREAALIILVATAPISAAGLVSDVSKVWFWKTLRWFIASLLIAPAAALILGMGVKVSQGVIDGQGDKTVAAVGMAVVGSLMILIGALCPMVLFKLLAFVEPGTASGAALRQSWTDAGGMSGVLSGKGSEPGSSAATADDGGGRSQGEASAESAGMARMAKFLGPVGQGIGAAMKASGKAADLASDVLGQAGVGHPTYAAGMADYAAGKQKSRPSGAGSTGGDEDQPTRDGGPTPQPPIAPTPPMPGGGGLPAAPTVAGMPDAGGGAAGAEAGAIPVVPV
jgi:type IV secretion system protein TrbL